MAAYAALVSLENIIDNLRHHSPITLHHQQLHRLTQNITLLQEFIEFYNRNLPYSKEADPLESRIARAAYVAEDAIESHILDHFTDNDGEKMSSDGLYQALEKVIEDMVLIQKEAMAKEAMEKEAMRKEAYASLVTVVEIIKVFRNHPRPPITLDRIQVHNLTRMVTFLQEFLEFYNPNLPYSKEADYLECRIARAAYAFEDVIESHLSDQDTDNDGENMSSDSDGLYGALEKVIEDMALIEKEAMEIKETLGFKNQLHAKSTPPADSSGSSSLPQKNSSMVGADGLLQEMKEKLTTGFLDRDTIAIVGMGGSGKTTLALTIYHDDFMKDRFEIRAWVTISQEYSIRQILVQLLTQLIREPYEDFNESELGDKLYRHLYRRRFMIILDDMWDIKAWDEIKSFIPDKYAGSRVVITTRLTTLSSALSSSKNIVEMKLLDEDESWDLLSETVFGEKGSCPYGFEEIGKKIGRRCKGLPLSIVVVGGLLAESEQSTESWEYIEENFNAILNLQDGGRCSQALYMSYEQLPLHLRPCFLYMGIYSDDRVIRTSKLIRLWVAEGFLKPVSGKRPEDVAREYLKGLTDRNLVLIHKLGRTGNIKECKVHDLFRDLCRKEAQKEGFYRVYPGREIKYRGSRSVMSGTIPEIEEIDAFSSAPPARSLILDVDVDQELSPDILRLLRIVGSNAWSGQLLDNMHQLVNSRFFAFTVRDTEFPSLIWQFWNLQTLIVSHYEMEMTRFTAPIEIWYMSHIRHLYFNNLYLPDPSNVEDGIVLENLQTLATIRDFKCSEAMVERIPNVRKLKLVYREGVDERFCLTNLDRLDKLESLSCTFSESMCQMNYPQSLKKLNLEVHISVCWEDILDKIGALPFLEKLQLYGGTFKGHWEANADQFESLKFLSLSWCQGLQVLTLGTLQFSRLVELHLYGLDDLQEIAVEVWLYTKLRLIVLEHCSDSAVESTKRLLKDRKERLYYKDEDIILQIEVRLSENNDPALERLSSRNFHVTSLLF